MTQVKKENTYKLITLGDSQVGKSSFLRRYVNKHYTEHFTCTIGCDFHSKIFADFPDEEARKIYLWDTAGQERHSDACIQFFSLSERKSFENVGNWVAELEKNSSDNISKILMGCKSDLVERREVSFEEGQKLAESFGMQYVETSAKTGEGVEEAMKIFTKEIFSKPSINSIAMQIKRVQDQPTINNNYTCNC
ncbi:hypothetical protein FGO68_gene4272 [Halteria grandinella]|uniref:Uncharacterized protein n=1 Tax=Halteria grandinella TaxID=5974 RepID=A0A8J8SYQ4_HALGN|nr:hypothetical protein FGO68_gene4272 [Halteria grandinella]